MYTLIGILLVLWLLGFVGHVGGSFIHMLLVVCGVLFLINLFTTRTTV